MKSRPNLSPNTYKGITGENFFCYDPTCFPLPSCKDHYDRYSDWAIDQAIMRLRQRLTNVGFSNSVIKTVKGRGYQIDMSQF